MCVFSIFGILHFTVAATPGRESLYMVVGWWGYMELSSKGTPMTVEGIIALLAVL